MGIKQEISFNDDLLISAGLATGTGYGSIIKELQIRAAEICREYINLYPTDENPTVFQATAPINQEIMDRLELTYILLQTPLVNSVYINIDSPTEQQVRALLSGLPRFSIDTRVRTYWHSDTLKGRFKADTEHWVSSVDHLLEASHRYYLPNNTGVRFLSAAGREVMFNPMDRSDTLVITGKGNHSGYKKGIGIIGCPPNKLSLEAKAIGVNKW